MIHKWGLMHVYIKRDLKEKFEQYCKRKGHKMSTVLQEVIELMIRGEFDPFAQEKKDNGNIAPTH